MEPALSQSAQRAGSVRSSLLAAAQASFPCQSQAALGLHLVEALYRACANYATAVRCVSCACIDLSRNVACRKAPSGEGSPFSSH